ncbi:hypothetical protein S40285_10149 [Stachybotrys chlorohalonatus IBT 40285]|uniref:Uncharacterized protein n=1 Tax=Stachybotrys chlorohalonatus (strain IBT 40285) TaxID=1283841 RepID=A0A084QLZ4_STAC4|nr:hypothetical protein S40285_10149 [Stachybotrys chlorohalonata IBT 40285]
MEREKAPPPFLAIVYVICGAESNAKGLANLLRADEDRWFRCCGVSSIDMTICNELIHPTPTANMASSLLPFPMGSLGRCSAVITQVVTVGRKGETCGPPSDQPGTSHSRPSRLVSSRLVPSARPL